MAALTSILGTSEIKVGLEPRQMQRVYNGYAGVNGLTVMNLGSRGYAVPIIGKLRITGAASFAAAKTAMIAKIAAVESVQALPAATYTYGGETYAYGIFEAFKLLPGPGNATFHWHPGGSMTVDFVMILRCLI